MTANAASHTTSLDQRLDRRLARAPRLALAVAATVVAAIMCGFQTAPDDPGAQSRPAASPDAEAGQVFVVIKTTMGAIVLELDAVKAPITVENFLTYVEDGFFEGTVFHRVIPEFMIQGGGMGPDMNRKQTRSPIKNESDNGLSNKRGTIAMARTSDIDSATSQFFINVGDNAQLDGKAGLSNMGYAVFGKVVAGMDVADAIVAVPTGIRGGHRDVPVEPITIEAVQRLTPEDAAKVIES